MKTTPTPAFVPTNQRTKARHDAAPRSDREHAFRLLERLRALPRAGVGNWPTPLQEGERLGGGPLWIKRDDASGLGRGGAKARKIDLVMGHLLANGYDELVTVAGNVTNLAFDLLPALDASRIRPTLFILDDPPLPRQVRERNFAGVLDRVTLLGPGYGRAARAVLEALRYARKAGRKPFALLPGGSHPSGVLGNALGFVEMVEQLEGNGEPLPSRVFITAATGTTLAGFLLGEQLLRLTGRAPISIVGAEVYGGSTALRTLGLLRWSENALGLRARVPATRLCLDRSNLAGGFGHVTPAQRVLCERVEQRLGLAIDPIFGGKTWAVLERHATEAEPRDRRPLYWHCGYTPEWRELADAVKRDDSHANA